MTPVEMWLMSAAGAAGYAAVQLSAACCLFPALALAALTYAMKHWPAKKPGP